MKYLVLVLVYAQVSLAQISESQPLEYPGGCYPLEVAFPSVKVESKKYVGVSEADVNAIEFHYTVKEAFVESGPISNISKIGENLFLVGNNDCSALVKVNTQTIYPVIDSNVDCYEQRVAELKKDTLLCLPK